MDIRSFFKGSKDKSQSNKTNNESKKPKETVNVTNESPRKSPRKSSKRKKIVIEDSDEDAAIVELEPKRNKKKTKKDLIEIDAGAFFGNTGKVVKPPIKKITTSKAKVVKPNEPSISTKKRPIEPEPIDDASSKKAKSTDHGSLFKANQSKVEETKVVDNSLPVGELGCLAGLAFVVTGKPDLCSTREELENLIREYGGDLKSSVSKKTTYLVATEFLDDGRKSSDSRKYKTAEEKGVEIINESFLFNLIRTNKGKSIKAMTPVKPTKKGKKLKPASKPKYDAKQDRFSLWSDRYKPKCAQDVIGNASNVKYFTTWLNDWEAVHIKKTKQIPHNKLNPRAKAVLISGPPGIGKSSSVSAIGKSLGYDIFELNASDTRSKQVLKENLSAAVTSKDLNFTSGQTFGKQEPKRLIVMDEVDGMSSGDRGGIQELIKIIKTSRTPIVCICNDRAKSAVRTLANYCFDLKFSRPDRRQVTKRMLEICQQEGMSAEPQAIEHLVNSTGNDIRQVINMLQMWKSTSNEITFRAVKERENTSKKDGVLRLNHFDACSFIMNESAKPGKFGLAFDAFFTDIDMVPLMISEQYLTGIQATAASMRTTGSNVNMDLQTIERVAKAAEAVSDADEVATIVRGKQQWGLLPLQAALNIRVAGISAGRIGFPRFPEWLGKNSTRNKRHRLLGELAMHLRQSMSCNRTGLRLDYVSIFRDIALNFLLNPEATGGPAKLIDFMDEYGLSRDDVFETFQELQFANFGNKFEKIPSKVKASFTREYNKRGHRSQALVWEQPMAGKGGKRKKKSKKDLSLAMEGEEADLSEEEEEDIASFAKTNRKTKATKSKGKGKKKGKASSSKG